MTESSHSIVIYTYSLCSTCRKALEWLEANDLEVKVIDILKSPPTKKLIVQAIKKLGDRKYLLNTSGKSYRSIGAAKIKLMSNESIIYELVNDPKLIKRPFLVIDGLEFLVGFKKDIWEQALLL